MHVIPKIKLWSCKTECFCYYCKIWSVFTLWFMRKINKNGFCLYWLRPFFKLPAILCFCSEWIINKSDFWNLNHTLHNLNIGILVIIVSQTETRWINFMSFFIIPSWQFNVYGVCIGLAILKKWYGWLWRFCSMPSYYEARQWFILNIMLSYVHPIPWKC